MVFLTHSLMFSQDFLFRYKENPNTNNLLNCMDSNLSKGSLNKYYETNVCPCNNTHQKTSGCFRLPCARQSVHSTENKGIRTLPTSVAHGPLGSSRLLQGNPRGHNYSHNNNACHKKWTSAETTECAMSQQMD